MPRISSGLALALLLSASAPALAQEAVLPADAQAIVDQFQRASGAIRAKAEKEIDPLRRDAVAKLKAIQDQHCRAARLDEALAVRATINQILGVNPDPGALRVTPDEIGTVRMYQVTGTTTGAVWGTEVYTSDSNLGAAAVHMGLLKPGEKGIIRVRVIDGQQAYQGSTRNGVTSSNYGPWNVSFTIERVQAP